MDKVRKYKSLYSSTCNTFAIGEGETITPASVTGLPQDTEITLTFDRVDSAGNKTPAKMERIRGKIVGGNFVISQGGRGADGTTEQVHTAPVVEMIWNASDWNDAIDWALIEHGQDGKHTSGLVTSLKATGAEINTGTEDAKIVTPKALADSDYAKTTDITVTADSTTTFTNKTLISPKINEDVALTATSTQLNAVAAGGGWSSAAETWEFVSVDDPTGIFRVNADVTGKYSAGMRIKMTNGGNVIYGIITVVSAYEAVDAGYTHITFLHQIDPTDSLALYLMANSAITANYYSTQKAPYAFPMSPAKWTVEKLDTSRRQEANPSNLTWYNLGTTNCQLSIPIGVWNVSYGVRVGAGGGGVATDIVVNVTLSTANNSEISKRYTASHYSRYLSNGAGGTAINAYLGRDFVLTLTSKTLYYLNGSLYASTAQADLSFMGNENTTVISATCAYL